jgi:NAD(P)H-hydrate epimerase
MLVLSREKVHQVDRRAIDEYGMSGLVLMENAGRGVVEVLCSLGVKGPVAICCGKGNNAGDGFVIARHLDLRGIPARVVLLVDPVELTGDAAVNFRIVKQAALPFMQLGEFSPGSFARARAGCEWIVDALLGTGARGAPRSPFAESIEQTNATSARRLAVDLPSGLDCDTGAAASPTFVADHTCTFVAHKPGFLQPSARYFTGDVHVVDIGVPRKLIESIASGC